MLMDGLVSDIASLENRNNQIVFKSPRVAPRGITLIVTLTRRVLDQLDQSRAVEVDREAGATKFGGRRLTIPKDFSRNIQRCRLGLETRPPPGADASQFDAPRREP